MSSHESRIDSHIMVQSPVSATNEIVDVASVSKPIVEKVQPRRSKRLPSSSLIVAQVTWSKSKKKSREPILR